MRQKMNVQMTFKDYEFLKMSYLFSNNAELEKISALLDETPEFLEAVAKDLQAGLEDTGAEGMAVEQALRSAILYQLEDYSYRELAERLGADYNFRKFTRFYGRPIPHFTNLEKAIKPIRPQTWERLNDLLVQLAIKKKVEAGATVRGDTTVAEANIHYPTDASLLWDSVRTLDRLMAGAREELPRCRFVYHDRTRRAKRRAYQITMAKGKHVATRRQRWYRDLLKVCAAVVELARGCVAALESCQLGFAEASLARLIKSAAWRTSSGSPFPTG